MCRRNSFSDVKYYSALFILAGLLFSLVVPTQVKIAAASNPNAARQITAAAGYGKTPLLFEMNKGQTDRGAKFISRVGGYTLYLADTHAVFSLKTPSLQDRGVEAAGKMREPVKFGTPDILTMRFAGANPAPAIEGGTKAVTKTNYYIGKKRIENVPNFRQVSYKNLYDGIDAVFYGNQNNRLEYDFVVAPGAEAGRIALDFEGAENVAVNENGDLVIKTANAELVQPKPFSYQETDGQRKEIASRYVVSGANTVRFELGEYDASKTLIIDPTLTYLTYIGGNEPDDVNDIAVDSQGNAYIAGQVESLNFHGQQRNSNDQSAAFAARLNATGTDFDYITILEGNRFDFATGIAVGPGNAAYVTGQASRDFPTTPGAYDDNLGGSSDAFLVKLDTQGVIQFSTYFGGSSGQDFAFDLAVDATGKAYLAGTTLSGLSFPKENEFQGCGAGGLSTNTYDAYLTVFNSTGTGITYSTCLGGGGITFVYEDGYAIALDSSNNAYIAGRTNAPGFPTKNAFQPEKGGGIDAFVTKINPSASGDASLVYSTFLGGSGTDTAKGIAVDADGRAYVTGFTGSVNFPLQGAFDSSNQVNEAFVTVLNSSGNALQNSSFLGGDAADSGEKIAVGLNGLIYVTGFTQSTTTFPVSPLTFPIQPANAGGQDAFVAKLRFGGGVITSSFLGGSGNDKGQGIAVRGTSIFVVGKTESNNLATTAGVVKPASNANAVNTDGFVARILDTHVDSVGVFRPASSFLLTQSTTNVVAQSATLTSGLAGQRGVAGDWDGDGIDTIGTFSNGTWKVRNVNFPIILAPPVTTVTFGAAGDLPVAGDWNGDGIDTPGIFRPSNGRFTLTDVTTPNPPFTNHVTVANFGTAGDLPISGDWDGDGKDSIAVYRPSTGETFFTNDDVSVKSSAIQNPGIDFIAFLGIAEDLPFAGDWNGDGRDSLGLWRPSTTEMILSDDNINLRAVFLFGLGTDQPIAGDWDGRPNP